MDMFGTTFLKFGFRAAAQGKRCTLVKWQGAMLLEAEDFFDRALALYLLRNHLRALQASTWAGVSVYYSNYFLALSFLRLHMQSVTHLGRGSTFEVVRIDDNSPLFSVAQRGERQRHADVWRAYYRVIHEMGWPDLATVAELAPGVALLRFREQEFRERINYRPGEGFEELHMTRVRYRKALRASLADGGESAPAIADAAYVDRMARKRLEHVGGLLKRLSGFRNDLDVEATLWSRRRGLITLYSHNAIDKAFAHSLLPDT